MLKAKQLRDESREELVAKREALRAEIFLLRSDRQGNQAQKTHLIGQKRKEIARIMTVLVEKSNEG